MRLTNKDRWRYGRRNAGLNAVNYAIKHEEWLATIKKLVPSGKCEYLELGAAPGTCSAALCKDNDWVCSGIDYSEDADLFLSTLESVGKQATLYKMDIFETKIDKKFDIVSSFGLVEHFRGASLDKIFNIHDAYLRKGGYLIIEVPNFTGFHYFWRYIFDKPELDNHNIDVMQPKSMCWFEDKGYEIIYNDYVGIMRLSGNSGWTKYWFTGKAVAAAGKLMSLIAKGLAKIGVKLQGQTFSPALLFIAHKK